MQFFELIVLKVREGLKETAQRLFKQMPKQYQRMFIKSALLTWSSGLTNEEITLFIDVL